MMDIQCLDRLSDWSTRLNLFDVLGISRLEIRHSAFLAWLLNPGENHGLGGGVLCGMLKKLASAAPGVDILQTLLMDPNDFQVLREWRHIDLLAISHESQFLIAIENKIGADERDKQLSEYWSVLQEVYPDYQKILVFLTPDGRLPNKLSDQEIWLPFSYAELVEIIETAKENTCLADGPALLIQHYIDTVRRNIVGDIQLETICQQIYTKHRQALDLIYENRYDAVARIAAIARSWCKEKDAHGDLAFDPLSPANAGKRCVRFTTPQMTRLLPELDEPVSGWKTKSIYYYEIEIREEYIKIALSVSSEGLSDAQRSALDYLSNQLGKRDKKANWRWKRLGSWKRYSFRSDVMSDDFSEELHSALDRYWREIVRFERETENAQTSEKR